MIRRTQMANRGGAPRKSPLSPLGLRIDALADARGVSLLELSATAGISRQALGHIRSGKTTAPTAQTAIALSRALGVTVESLFGEPEKGARGRPATVSPSYFGVRVQRRLDETGRTRRELAKACDLDPVTLWRWMRGRSRVPASGLFRVARALRCDPADLVPRG